VNVLFIATRVPQLNGKGDELVSYYRLKALVDHGHRVWLVCCMITPLTFGDSRSIDVLQRLGIDVKVILVPLYLRILNIIRAFLFSSLPFQVAIFASPRCKALIERLVKQCDPDFIHLFLIRAGSNIPLAPIPLVVDYVDSLSLNYSRAASKVFWFLRPLYYAESKRCLDYERRLSRAARLAFAVSSIDAARISVAVSVIPNGVNTGHFAPSFGDCRSARLIFTGNMNYAPNAEAVIWFCKNCWLRVLDLHPDAELVVCGADPLPSVVALSVDYPSVRITGRVPSIAYELSQSCVSIAPMQSGAGMQNKILEAMSCGVPVVATSLGLGSISARPGLDILVADSPSDFVHCVHKLLSNEPFRSHIVSRARSFVLRCHNWRSIGGLFMQYVERGLAL
jgi:glycosyltransferase involved in cell wall biosynthesis